EGGWNPTSANRGQMMGHPAEAVGVSCFGALRFRCSAAVAEEEVGGDEGEEDDGDDAVHGEEGGVEAGEVTGGDEQVLPEKQCGYGGDAHAGDGSEMEEEDQPDQQSQHEQMHGAGD